MSSLTFQPVCRVLILCSLVMGWPWPMAATSQTLTNFAQVRALTQESAEKQIPVRLDAIVLGADPAIPWNLFLHDGSAGCYVQLTPGTNTPKLPAGTKLRLNGVTQSLGYYPSVTRTRAKVIGKGEIPSPVRLVADQIFSPEMDSAWVEVPARIVGYETGDKRFTLDIQVYGSVFKAELPLQDESEKQAAALMQRPVLMRGILGTIFNRQWQMTDRHFFVPSFNCITPTLPPVGDEPDPLIKVAQILTGGFGPQDHIRIRGVVTQAEVKGFYLRDASGSTLVYDGQKKRFPPGTQVEITGFGDVAPFRPILRATRVVELAQTNPPPAVQFNFTSADLPMMQFELVMLEADYLGRKEGRLENIFQCRTGQQIFEALLPREKSPPPDFTPGDKILLTGICELTTTHALPRIGWVDGFRLHLAASNAVRVITPAPWWNTRRLVVALGITSTVALLGLLGTWMLRQQVNKQMAIISDSLRAEAVGKERDRMARELHDTLEQQLSGVALQLDGLDDAIKKNPESAAKILTLARRMLRYIRLEARRSVWDLRSKVLEKQGLVAALQSMTESTTGVKIELQVHGDNLKLPAAVEFHLFRIAQEALANAVKHSHASVITLVLEYGAENLCLSVRDNGCGFDHQTTEKIPGPHFGLMGMRERAAKIGGKLNLEAAPQKGCSLSVTIPKILIES